MTIKYLKTPLLCILVFMLCSVILPAVAGDFTLDHLKITSDPTDGTTYTGDREIDPLSKLIQKEDWNPEKVPPLIKYRIEAHAKGPGTLTFYLGTGGNSQTVGSWQNGSPLSDGEGTYRFYTLRLNEDNYDFPSDYDAPYYDECIPWLNKGYKAEIVESTNSTLSIDGGRATFNAIDTHVGGANTSQKKLEASAGWKKADVTIGYAQSSTQSWIYRPSATSLQVPENSLSLNGSFSVSLNDTSVSGSQTKKIPANCVLCEGCDEYVDKKFAHRVLCSADGHLNSRELVYYYTCVPKDLELHKPRTCSLWGCRKTYWNCSPDEPVCAWWPAKHRDDSSANTSDSPGLSSDGGLYAASPGESHTARLTTAIPYHTVYWYAKTPWDTSYYGTNEETDSGDGLTNEASFGYVFPSGAMHTGSFKITAYIYTGDSNVKEYSYAVTVSVD